MRMALEDAKGQRTGASVASAVMQTSDVILFSFASDIPFPYREDVQWNDYLRHGDGEVTL
jgi:hypothetical protein